MIIVTDEMALAVAKSDYAFDGRGDWDKASRVDRERYIERGRQSAAAMVRLSASEIACYRWPENTAEHRASRAAYMDGAAALTPEQISIISDMIHAWVEDKGQYREAFRSDCKRLLATRPAKAVDVEAVKADMNPNVTDKSDLIAWLKKASSAVYLACESAVADDISDGMKNAATEIASLRERVKELEVERDKWDRRTAYDELKAREYENRATQQRQVDDAIDRATTAERERDAALAEQLAAGRERCAKVDIFGIALHAINVGCPGISPVIRDGVARSISAGTRAAIRSLEPAIGEFVLVPREPTMAMIEAGDFDLDGEHTPANSVAATIQVYKRMIAATPKTGGGS